MKIVSCNRSDDLECFLNALKGEKCYHWRKHFHDPTCRKQTCARDGCKIDVKCIEVKEDDKDDNS